MFSVVIPVYRNRENLPDLLEACEHIKNSLSESCEFVFVIDGSPDDSAQFLKEQLSTRSLRSQLVNLSRNFGSFPAIMAGLSSAEGEYVGVMAADLQEPPDFIIKSLEILKAGDADVCLGTRSQRNDSLFSNLSSKIFWGLYRSIVNPRVPEGGIDVFAVNRLALNELLNLKESNSSLVGLLTWVGFNVVEVPYERQKRLIGKSAWTLKKKFKYLFDSIYSFTDLPIRILFGLGLFGITISAIFSIIVLVIRLTSDTAVPGYTAVALLITFFGSLQIFALSIIGSYTWRGYENTKHRPNFIIANNMKFGRGD